MKPRGLANTQDNSQAKANQQGENLRVNKTLPGRTRKLQEMFPHKSDSLMSQKDV
jgi:hypothetical protein